MANPPRAAQVYPTAAILATYPGQPLERYATCLDQPFLYLWVPANSDTADGWNVLGHVGGVAGRWKRQRFADKGADLASGSQTLLVSGKTWRTMPAATLAANSTITLGTTLAVAGDTIGITRLDVGAFTMPIVNGGAAAGTLCTFPISQRSWGLFYFDGANWSVRASGALLS